MYTKEILELAVKSCKNYSQVLLQLGKQRSGSSHSCIKRAIARLNIDISHFEKRSIIINNKRKSYVDILIKSDIKADSYQLRRALLESGREYCCDICKLTKWLDEQIVLEIHHIDGDNTNNISSNLQFLCPNCHSQTPNFYHTKLQYFCACGKPITKKAKLCHKCASSKPRPLLRKVERPNKETLEKLVWEKPTTHIAKHFGVSDKAINKWCKNLNINKPPRGYWTKFR